MITKARLAELEPQQTIDLFREAHDYIANTTRYRRRAARVLRYCRKEWGSKLTLKLWAHGACGGGLLPREKTPPRPTRGGLVRMALQHIRWSSTSWADTSTEYYSTCGNDDYQYERRRAARQHGQMLLLAARLLPRKGPA